MKLQFKNQKFQSDAAKAVTDSFIGQRNAAMHEYTLDMGKDNQATFFDVVGFRNAPLNIDSIHGMCSQTLQDHSRLHRLIRCGDKIL